MKKYTDIITGGIGLAIGIAVLIMSIQIGMAEGQTIGADFLPKIIAVLMILLSAKLTWDGVKSAKNYEDIRLDYEKNYLGVAILMVAAILYAQLLKKIGFIITSMLFLYLALCLISKKEETNYVKFAVITVVMVLLIYFVFTKGFSIRLPKGILKF